MIEGNSRDVDELQSLLRDRDQDVDWLWSSGRTLGAQLSARLAKEAKSAGRLLSSAVDATQAAESRATAAEKRAIAAEKRAIAAERRAAAAKTRAAAAKTRAAAAERRAAAAEALLSETLKSETWAVGRAVLYGPRYVAKRLRLRRSP